MTFRVSSLVYSKEVAIMNIGGSATDCASDHAGLCVHSGICYAKKAETQYKRVLPYRRRQGHAWRHTDARTFADALTWLHSKGVKHFRFNESGDFWSQRDVDKLNEVADLTPMNIFGYSANPFLNFVGCQFNVKISQAFKVPGTTGRAIAVPKGTKAPKGFLLCPKTSGKMQKCTDGCRVCFGSKKIDVCFYEH